MDTARLKSTIQCHASTIVETPAGLVASWFGGTREGHPDVGIWVSRQIDGTWSAPYEAANGIQGPDERFPCWNPVLFYPDGGPLLLFYKVGPTPAGWWGMLLTSKDDGVTWSASRKLGEHQKIGHLLGPVKNKPIQLQDGSILCPSSIEEGQCWRVHFERSHDRGQTWEVIGPIHDGVAYQAIQPSILQYPDGRMQILCRSKQGVIVQSWSKDGQNWAEIRPTPLPNPNAGTDAVTLMDGRQLLVYNPSTQYRSPLTIALSLDGIYWRNVRVLEDKQGEFSYPAVIQSADGHIHITYTYQRECIKYAVLELRELEI